MYDDDSHNDGCVFQRMCFDCSHNGGCVFQRMCFNCSHNDGCVFQRMCFDGLHTVEDIIVGSVTSVEGLAIV